VLSIYNPLTTRLLGEPLPLAKRNIELPCETAPQSPSDDFPRVIGFPARQDMNVRRFRGDPMSSNCLKLKRFKSGVNQNSLHLWIEVNSLAYKIRTIIPRHLDIRRQHADLPPHIAPCMIRQPRAVAVVCEEVARHDTCSTKDQRWVASRLLFIHAYTNCCERKVQAEIRKNSRDQT
jgi:hypothetical protein